MLWSILIINCVKVSAVLKSPPTRRDDDLSGRHSILEPSAPTMLAELLSHERALLEFVLAQLDTRSLAMCARAAQWLF